MHCEREKARDENSFFFDTGHFESRSPCSSGFICSDSSKHVSFRNHLTGGGCACLNAHAVMSTDINIYDIEKSNHKNTHLNIFCIYQSFKGSVNIYGSSTKHL